MFGGVGEQHMSGKDLRAVSGISFTIKIFDKLDELRTNVETLGMGYIRTKMPEEVKNLKMIMNTAGDSSANDLLIIKINKLDFEINKEFSHIPLILKSIQQVYDTFRLATGRHFQSYETITQKTLIKAMGSEGVLDQPKIYFRKPKKKKQKDD